MQAALSLLSIGLLASTALSQATEWTSGGTGGLWTDATKWSLGHVPLVGEIVYIADGSTVDFNGTTTPQVTYVNIGTSSMGSGGLTIDAGTLNCDNLFIGASNVGTVALSGTGTIQAAIGVTLGANGLGSDGTFQMDNGSVITPRFVVGNVGNAQMTITGGQIDATASFSIANSASISSIFTMTGGIINTPNFNFASSGSADFTITDGEINSGLFYGGNNSTASAVVNIQGGTITAADFYNGWQGAVSTRQTGGLVDVNQLGLAPGNGTGFYSLLGGTLDATIIYRGATATYAFNMSGGTLITSQFGQWNKNIDLKPTGGTILPGGLNNAPTYIRGDFNLGLAAGVEYQLPGDKLVMQDSGTVELAGSLTVALVVPLAASSLMIIIDNDDADPVVGTFSGLPEGATITPVFAGTPYPMQITYVGGDGNDVALVYDDCPVDFTNDGVVDNGDIGAFITLFLAGDLAADVNNDGFLDNGDIIAFIAAFLAGC